MKKSLIAIFLPVVLLCSCLSCDRQNPETTQEFLTRQAWRPFQFEASQADSAQKLAYEAILAEMRITYLEDGSYSIEYINGAAPTENGSWELSAGDSLLSHFPINGPQRTLTIKDIQLISFVYSLQDSIGPVQVFCVAE